MDGLWVGRFDTCTGCHAAVLTKIDGERVLYCDDCMFDRQPYDVKEAARTREIKPYDPIRVPLKYVPMKLRLIWYVMVMVVYMPIATYLGTLQAVAWILLSFWFTQRELKKKGYRL